MSTHHINSIMLDFQSCINTYYEIVSVCWMIRRSTWLKKGQIHLNKNGKCLKSLYTKVFVNQFFLVEDFTKNDQEIKNQFDVKDKFHFHFHFQLRWF